MNGSVNSPWMEHLVELRQRLMVAVAGWLVTTVLCYLFAENIYGYLVRPLAVSMAGEEGRRLIYTGLTEAFFTYIKVALFAGFILSFPLSAFQLYRFVAPGLYMRERRIFLPFLIASPVLFLAGAALVYYFIFPLAWQFFLGFETSAEQTGLPVMLEARVSEYLSLVMQLIIAFGMAFQLPILLMLLSKAGMVTAEGLAKRRRYAIVIIVAVAAIITPPDVLTQIALAIPLLLLYEFSIIMCRLMAKDTMTLDTDE